jgi:hypothetical protein
MTERLLQLRNLLQQRLHLAHGGGDQITPIQDAEAVDAATQPVEQPIQQLHREREGREAAGEQATRKAGHGENERKGLGWENERNRLGWENERKGEEWRQ